MTTSESIKELVGALVAARQTFTVIAKTATNPHLKSKYAPLENIREATEPHLLKNGLTFTQPIGVKDGMICITNRLDHAASGQFMEEMFCWPTPSKIQDLGAAITYLRRYTGAPFLGVCAEDDTDGQHLDEGKKSNGVDSSTLQVKQAAKHNEVMAKIMTADDESTLLRYEKRLPELLKNNEVDQTYFDNLQSKLVSRRFEIRIEKATDKAVVDSADMEADQARRNGKLAMADYTAIQQKAKAKRSELAKPVSNLPKIDQEKLQETLEAVAEACEGCDTEEQIRDAYCKIGKAHGLTDEQQQIATFAMSSALRRLQKRVAA